jgi:outer membrane protein TolC
VSLSLPFFDRGQADAARARARLKVARANERIIAERITSEVVMAKDNLRRVVAHSSLFERTHVSRLNRFVRRVETTYREGERPIFELLDAYRTARATRLRALSLRLAARLAEIELWRAHGLGPGGTPP